MTNSLVDRWNRGCDSLLLLQEADQTITQLHAAVKTAQELAATRLMDVGRLTRERHEYKIWWERDSKSLGTALNDLSLERACKQDLQAQLRQVVAIGFEAGVEAQRRSHEPCERHRWKPGMWNVYYVRSDGQERPALSAETAEGAANALRQDAADLVRVIESEGASRDASSEPKCGLCGKPGITEFVRTCCAEGRARDLATARTAKRTGE